MQTTFIINVCLLRWCLDLFVKASNCPGSPLERRGLKQLHKSWSDVSVRPLGVELWHFKVKIGFRSIRDEDQCCDYICRDVRRHMFRT